MPETPGESAAAAPTKAVSKGAAFLKAKTFGMPRWVFLAMLVGAVGVGLYLRSRQASAEEEEFADAEEELYPTEPYEDTLAASDDPGLAGAGVLAGPAGGSVVPFNIPQVPEGYPEVFASLTDQLGESIAALADIRVAEVDAGTVDAETPQPGETPAGTPDAPTGGGPPNSNTHGGGRKLTLGRTQYKKLLEQLEPEERKALRETASRDGNIVTVKPPRDADYSAGERARLKRAQKAGRRNVREQKKDKKKKK